MAQPMINRRDTIEVFRELMQTDSPFRVLRLVGDAKMGKTHLITQVYPEIVKEAGGWRCAVVDLRNRAQTSLDILHVVSRLCGGEGLFPRYAAGYQDWLHRPLVEVKGLQALLSNLWIRGDEETESRKWTRYLTTQLTTDLGGLVGEGAVLLFDAVNETNDGVRDWLADTLLVELAGFAHVRAVVAGRSVPDAHGSYVGVTRSFELRPVEDEREYIGYCHAAGVELAEQSICDLARALDYCPGHFVDRVISRFVRQEAGHG